MNPWLVAHTLMRMSCHKGLISEIIDFANIFYEKSLNFIQTARQFLPSIDFGEVFTGKICPHESVDIYLLRTSNEGFLSDMRNLARQISVAPDFIPSL